MIRRMFIALGAVVAALLTMNPIAIPTAAATMPTVRFAAAAGPSITLTGQPAWSTLGDDVAFRLRLRADTTQGLEVHAIVYGAVLSRIAFERTLNGERLGRDVTAHSTPVDALPVVGADRLFTLGLQDPAGPFDANRLRLPIPGSGTAGVFPVKLELRESSSGRVLDDFVTDIVAVRRHAPGEVPSEPLQVGWVWNIAAPPPPPALTTAPNPELAQAIAPRGRLGRLATSLDSIGDLPVTIVANPATIDALRAGTSANPRAGVVLDAIRGASKAALVLSGPYPTLDGPSLIRDRLASAFDTAMTTGRATLESGLSVAADHTIAPTQPLDDPTLNELRLREGTTRLVLDPAALAPADGPDQFTPARPFRLDTASGSFEAMEVNAIASDLLTRAGPDALRAQQLLASLAVIALEQPNRTRGVVINTPLLWNVSPARTDAVSAGLRDHPLLEGATLSDLFRIQPATVKNKPYVRTLAPNSAGPAPVSARAFATANRNVDALASMIGAGEPIIGQLRNQLLLSLASRVPGTGASVSSARLSLVNGTVGAVTSQISTSSSRSVTLTSRRASVPLSIENRSGRPVKVRVTLASQKLDFPNGSDQIVDLPSGNTTIQFDVEARASGTFPVLVTVSSADGRLDLQRARYTVRSSGVSGVGLVLTIGAGLFLAAWWLTHWRRSRRAPTPALAT